MKCRFRGLADHSHVKQVHVECKANKETAPARGPAGGERVTRAYTVEVQTASVFYSRRVLSS